jgi:hypothetical protein
MSARLLLFVVIEREERLTCGPTRQAQFRQVVRTKDQSKYHNVNPEMARVEPAHDSREVVSPMTPPQQPSSNPNTAPDSGSEPGRSFNLATVVAVVRPDLVPAFQAGSDIARRVSANFHAMRMDVTEIQANLDGMPAPASICMTGNSGSDLTREFEEQLMITAEAVQTKFAVFLQQLGDDEGGLVDLLTKLVKIYENTNEEAAETARSLLRMVENQPDYVPPSSLVPAYQPEAAASFAPDDDKKKF